MSIEKKALIVQDGEIDSEVLAQCLEELGYSVTTVVKGTQEDTALRSFEGLVIKRTCSRDGLSEEQMHKEGCLELDPEHYEIKKNGVDLKLTLREFKLLPHLIRGRGRIYTREELLSDVWGYGYIGDVRTVDVMIRRIREKLEDVPSKPEFIKTKRGVGYYFDINASRSGRSE